MRTTGAAVLSCTGGLLVLSTGNAFLTQPTRVLSSQPMNTCSGNSVSSVAPAAATGAAYSAAPRSPPKPATMGLSGIAGSNTRGVGVGVGVGVRRTRGMNVSTSMSMSSSMSSFDDSAPRARASPAGPGAGVIDLKFESLKTGGFKVFLLFFLLGQGRAKDNDTPFSVRDTPEGIRVLIGDETKNDSQWEGVLDLSWGVEPRPFFRVDRIDVNEVVPYKGELYILNKLLDAIIDVNGEQSVDDNQKLFMFRKGEQSQLAEAKATLAGMAALE